MKITRRQLRRIIKEVRALNEGNSGGDNTSAFLRAFEEVVGNNDIEGQKLGKTEWFDGYNNAIRFTKRYKAGTKKLGDKHMGRQEFTMPDDSMMNIKELEIDLNINTALSTTTSSLKTLYDKMYEQYGDDPDKMLLYLKIVVKDPEGGSQSGVGRDRQASPSNTIYIGSDEEDIDLSENPDEMGKKLGEACMKFHKALKEKYEGTTEDSDIPVDTDLKALANKIFSPMKMYIYSYD